MIETIVFLLVLTVPGAVAILWMRKTGGRFSVACTVYCTSSAILWLVSFPFINAGLPIAAYVPAAILGGGMSTLIFFVPGLIIYYGAKNRTAWKIISGIVLYGFWALLIVVTRGQT